MDLQDVAAALVSLPLTDQMRVVAALLNDIAPDDRTLFLFRGSTARLVLSLAHVDLPLACLDPALAHVDR